MPSDDLEIDGVQPWLDQLRQDLDTKSKVGSFTGIDCSTWEQVCGNLVNPNDITLGFRFVEGQIIAVTGEEPEYERNYNPTREGIVTDLTNASREDGGYLVYYASCGELQCVNQYQVASRFIILELPEEITQTQLQASLNSAAQSYSSGGVGNNAILNQWHDPNIYHWSRIRVPETSLIKTYFNSEIDLSGIYWGEVGEDLIRLAVSDYQTDFNKMPVRLSPIRTQAPVTIGID